MELYKYSLKITFLGQAGTTEIGDGDVGIPRAAYSDRVRAHILAFTENRFVLRIVALLLSCILIKFIFNRSSYDIILSDSSNDSVFHLDVSVDYIRRLSRSLALLRIRSITHCTSDSRSRGRSRNNFSSKSGRNTPSRPAHRSICRSNPGTQNTTPGTTTRKQPLQTLVGRNALVAQSSFGIPVPRLVTGNGTQHGRWWVGQDRVAFRGQRASFSVEIGLLSWGERWVRVQIGEMREDDGGDGAGFHDAIFGGCV